MRPDLAPNHVARIKELVREGFYDGIVFHRVIEGFMAQTGCPHGTGTGGSGKKLKAEFIGFNHAGDVSFGPVCPGRAGRAGRCGFRQLGVPLAGPAWRTRLHRLGVFRSSTSYFGNSGQTFMINFRVSDLDGALKRLRHHDLVDHRLLLVTAHRRPAR